jgi:hypothetical protein
MATRPATSSDVLGSALWAEYDFSKLTGTAGAGISSVPDQSTNSQALAEANPGYQPTLTSLNGLAAALFNNSGLHSVNPPAVLDSTVTVFAVVKSADGANGRVFSIAPAGAYDNQTTGFGLLLGGGTPTIFRNNPFIAFAGPPTNASTGSVIDCDISASPHIYTDGTIDTYNWGGSLGPVNAGRFGLGNNVGTDEYDFLTNTVIGHVVVATGPITLSQRQQIQGILAWKWGTQANLPANHPYKSAAPTVTTADPVAVTARRRPLILMAS